MLPKVLGSCITQSWCWLYLLVSPSLNFRIKGTSGKPQARSSDHIWLWANVTLYYFMYKGPNSPGAQLLQQATSAPPQRASVITLQPCDSPWGLPGALPSQLTKLLQWGWSVALWSSSCLTQKPGWTAKPNTPHKTLSSSPLWEFTSKQKACFHSPS